MAPITCGGARLSAMQRPACAEGIRSKHVACDTVTVAISGVMQLNPAGGTLVGVTEKEIRGRNWFTDFHPSENAGQLQYTYQLLMRCRS